MQLRLLESAARVALAVAILSFTVTGEPDPATRAAMEAEASAFPWGDSYLTAVEPSPSTVETPTLPASAEPSPTETLPGAPPTWIEAEAIGLYAPVVEVGWRLVPLGDVEVIEWEVPDDAAGFHTGSAYPGQPGNTVISGHNNVAGEVFRCLIDLEVGDRVTVYVGETPHHYWVVQKEIVREFGASEEQRRENAKWIAPTGDERLTLVTCWPYSGNSHRLIVVALPEP